MSIKLNKATQRWVLVFSTLTLLASTSVQAQTYTKDSILGVWEVSSLKLNGSPSFGKEVSQKRGEAYRLLFSKNNKVKNQNTGTIYNYEVLNGELKIYQLSKYGNNYQHKNPNRYDLWKFAGDFENCTKSKVISKKIPGYYRKEGYKWCKVEDYPQITKTTESDYNF